MEILFNTTFKGHDLPRRNLCVRIDRAIRCSGLLAFLSPEDFQTFIALLTFVDESGRCDLSGRTLGQSLNLSEKQAHIRLKKLCSLRWRGRPLVSRENGRETGRFLPTGYRVTELEGVKVVSGGTSQVVKANRNGSSRAGPIGDGSAGEGGAQDADAERRSAGEADLRKPQPSAEDGFQHSTRINDNCVGVKNINKHTEERGNAKRADEGREVFNRLLGCGVSKSIASELLERYPTERIARQLQMLPFRNAKEPAAMLIKAIKEDWSAPAAYVARKREEADRKARAEAEARAEQRREAWRKSVEEAKAKLPPEELEEITRTAREKVRRELRRVLHGEAPERLVKAEVNKIIARKYLKHAGS